MLSQWTLVFLSVQVLYNQKLNPLDYIMNDRQFVTYSGLLGVCRLTTEYLVAMVTARDSWSAAKNTR